MDKATRHYRVQNVGRNWMVKASLRSRAEMRSAPFEKAVLVIQWQRTQLSWIRVPVLAEGPVTGDDTGVSQGDFYAKCGRNGLAPPDCLESNVREP